LYVTARGLTTSPIPYGQRVFQITFDFVDHQLRIETSDGAQRQLPLRPQSVADFYAAVIAALAELGITVHINEWPNEMLEHIRFSEDRTHAAYDPESAQRFWKILVQADRVFKLFRTGFLGKCSPVHFFWGSFDRKRCLRPIADVLAGLIATRCRNGLQIVGAALCNALEQ
jgi:hypothetical protein